MARGSHRETPPADWANPGPGTDLWPIPELGRAAGNEESIPVAREALKLQLW